MTKAEYDEAIQAVIDDRKASGAEIVEEDGMVFAVTPLFGGMSARERLV